MFIPGAPSFAEPLQGSIAHIIMMNFARRMEEFRSRDSQALNWRTLKNEINLFHDQMRYPWGQILSLETNAKSENKLNFYCAVRNLTNVVNIVESENYVKLLNKTDTEFECLWTSAKNTVIKFQKELLRFEILNGSEITASTVDLFNNIKREDKYLQKSLIKATDKVKIAWQTIWEKFKVTKKGFEYLFSELNGHFDIKISKIQPFVQDEILIILAVNKYNDIRMWARANTSLFKSIATDRPLKWVPTETIFTRKRVDWWVSAIKKIDLDQEENNFANICREESESTVY